MTATIKFNDERKDFTTIQALKTYLNEAFYYADELVLFSHKADIIVNYSETNDIASLIREAKFYGEVLVVNQIWN